MIPQFTHKHTKFTKILIVMALGLIILWQSVSLSRDPVPDLGQVSAQDIRLANSRPWQASSPWSPDGQWVALSSVLEGLYIQKADSNAERKQLGSPGVSRDAITWSWDGQELFYQVSQPIEEPPSTKRWIESVNIETGNVTEHPEVTSNALANVVGSQASSPWSPDGQWVALSSVLEGLYIQKADSNAERKQLGSPGVSRDAITWSWDGQELFYQVSQPIEEPPSTKRWIESVDIETGNVTGHPEWSTFNDLDSVVTSRSHSLPLWSPDGQWVALSSVSEGLYIQKADSSAERKQLGSPGVPRREIAWSWDSKKLFYQVNQPIEEPPFTKRWIESVDIETGNVTEHPEWSIYDDLDSVARARYPSDPILSFNFKDNIIEARTKNGTRHWRVTPDPVQYLSITLSPDKEKVLVYRSIYATDGKGHLIDLGEKPVGRASFGSWSPDSTKIIYTIEEDDGHTITASDIYVINADGTDEKQLTYTPDKLESDPRWSADGTKIVFHSKLLNFDRAPVHVAELLNFDRAPVHVADNVVYVADIVVVTE